MLVMGTTFFSPISPHLVDKTRSRRNAQEPFASRFFPRTSGVAAHFCFLCQAPSLFALAKLVQGDLLRRVGDGLAYHALQRSESHRRWGSLGHSTYFSAAR